MARKRRLREYIPRKEYRFWLRSDREGEARLMEFIDYLKKTRQFATHVKRGLRLLWTLGEGDLSYLLELYPHLAERLKPPTPPSAPDSGDLERLIEATVQSSVKAAMMELPSLPATIPSAAPLKPSGTLGAGKVMALPTFDDDDDQDTIVLSKASADTGANFQAGLASLGLFG